MNALLRVGLTNAAVAAALGVVAFVVARVGRRPALGHCLWLIVLLKLVSPPLWGVALPRLAAPAPAAVAPTIRLTASELAELAAMAEREAVAPAPPTPWQRLRARWSDGTVARVLGWAWVAGTGCCVAWMAVRIVRFQRLLRHAEPADDALQARADELAALMGLSRRPEVRVLPIAVSPLLWAVAGRARLVVPGPLWKRLGPAERDALLAHELAHFKRRDHWARWVELVAVGLHWWDPVAWWARRELERAEEACCDAWVVRALPGSAKAYARALLKTVEFLAESRHPLPPAASGAGRIPNLRRRVTMILRETSEHRLGAPARLAALAIGLLVLPLAPRPSTAQDPAPKPETPQVNVEVVVDDLATVTVDDLAADGAFLGDFYAALDDARAEDKDKDKGDLEARMRRLESRLDRLAALLEAKGGAAVTLDAVKADGPEGVVVLRPEQLKRLEALKLDVARLLEGQARAAKAAAKLADEAKAGGEPQAAEAEAKLKQLKKAHDGALKVAEERQARLVERVDQKLKKDAKVLQDHVLSLRLPIQDEEQGKKLAAEIDALVKKHAEAGDMSKLAEEIQDVIKKNAAVPPVVERFRPPVRSPRGRPEARYQKAEPEKPRGLDQRMERLEKRLDELTTRLEKSATPTPPKDDAPAKP